MATRRLHTDLRILAAKDLALQIEIGKFDETQNSDDLTQIVPPVDVVLAADAAVAQYAFPTGAVTLRFIAIMDVDSTDGIEVVFDNIANDPVIVKPNPGSGMTGMFIATVGATALYFGNPNSSAAVNFRLMMGFYAT